MEILVIVGPTAVGKSQYAIKMAQKYNGEIISCDSVQIYKDLNIGSGKIKTSEMQGIKHHLLSFVDPKKNYTVYDFQKDARKKIAEIKKSGKLPILCGGTGLYINATLYDYQFINESNYNNFEDKNLYENLLKLDPQEALKIGPNNKVRLKRALSIIANTNMTKTEKIAKQSQKMLYDAKIIFLTTNRDKLYNKINKRVDQMIEDGLINEVKKFERDLASQKTIGYKEIHEYLANEITLEEAIMKIKQNTRRYAKRQITWFKNKLPCEERLV